MRNVEILEKNVISSFQNARSDIHNLYEHTNFILKQLTSLKNENKRLTKEITELNSQIYEIRSKKSNGNGSKCIKNYIAAKGAKKFHEINCPFAKNIKPKNKIKLSSKVKALNQGYKACKCV
ncbi:hypothetical protein HN385_05930 [archaeon]|jgi:hypothetical protein|nr:hypothetical protein [archaeon]MBT3451103.1 hypothetical protein [archaeon]MBT6868653.1 hypothetical protein [archaeon]MBT7193380.1 hypothetical protein [archaeon]MBT7381450.1 hypothetical protein [archaeon]